MSYFWEQAKGVNADLKRHRNREAELRAKIDELEGKDDPMSIVVLRTYRHFLCQLQASKAEVVEKIGRKK